MASYECNPLNILDTSNATGLGSGGALTVGGGGRFSDDITNNNNYSAMIYSETADEFRFGYATSDTRGSITINSFVPVRVGGLNAGEGSNTMGSIFTTGGNVGIGNGFTVANANFTNLTAQNALVSNLTATGITVGALIANGNVNTVGSIYTTGGNVGIGTTQPGYTMDVNGILNVANNQKIGSGADINLSGQ
ncbi:MAG: hypothetical protein EBZ69_09505, partial [Alphaproteobacteria bacterium]|nr:hypothetical protein [Alphaproteobacteria bacterium]